MIYLTLNKILALEPSQIQLNRLLKTLNKTHADDEEISMVRVLQIAWLDFALECCQLLPEHDKHWRLYAVWCARQVVWSSTYKQAHVAIALAERFANGQATQAEFEDIQTSMAQHLQLADGAPGKTAAATTHKVAGLAARLTAASAAATIADYAGLKARLAVKLTGDEIIDYCNLNAAYDKARSNAYVSAINAQEREFIRLVTALG